MRIFLGGTCNNSDWRNKIIEVLEQKKIDYFNPVVEGDWSHEEELHSEAQKELCDILLWVVSPKKVGFYSMYEIGDLANRYPDKLWVCFLRHDKDAQDVNYSWTYKQMRSIRAIENRLKEKSHVKVFNDLSEIQQEIKVCLN